MRNKFISLILTILIFSFSIINCYAITPRAISYQYTIDQILDNGTVGYNTDTYYDNSFNIITYLAWLKTDDGHACSTVSSKYCTILNHYNSFMDSYSEIGDSYNYYVLTDLGSSRFNIYYILTNGEIYYQTDGANHWLKIDSGDIRYFVYNGAFESPSGRIVPWNGSNYVDSNPYFSIGGTSSNILLANVDVKDSNGNVIFEGNINVEEPEPVPDGSDVTISGISGVISNAFEKFGDFIVSIFQSIIDSITGFFSQFTELFELVQSTYLSYNPVVAFGKFIEFFTEFLSYARGGFDVITVFVQSIPTPFSYFIYVPLLLLVWFSVFRRLL